MSRHSTIRIPPSGVIGDLDIPDQPRGVVLFAHGSGSSRFSSRNRHVAALVQRSGFATLLLDLLTAEEEKIDVQTRHLRFDIELLSGRLVDATRFLEGDPATTGLAPAYFGASTGAAAALIAAAQLGGSISAVVSRGGRPDLAGASLPLVTAPTLLIVGGADEEVLALNQQALGQLRCEKELAVIPGATHLFEEPGTLDRAANLAATWFSRHERRG